MPLILLLLLLLDHVTMVTAVTGCHSDRDKDHRPRKNCEAAGLDQVPAGFEPKTKVLLFPNNLFSSLPWSSFQSLPEIYEIDLTGNKVLEVTSSDSPILPTLSVLRLGSNRLTSLSDHSFFACPSLTELYLEKNTIHSLSDQTFSGLSRLEILDLSSNHIKVLPIPMLHPLPAIETLYIENNKITVMPDGWFSQKEDIPYVYLSANPWDCTCSCLYLQTYLNEYDTNIYVRDGPIIQSGALNVVCGSPPLHQYTPVMHLEESDLCPPMTDLDRRGDSYKPIVTDAPYETTAAATTILPDTTVSSTPSPPLTEWSDYSESVDSEAPSVDLYTVATDPTLSTDRPTTQSPANTKTTSQTTPAWTTKVPPLILTSTTSQEKVWEATPTTTTPPITYSTPAWNKVSTVRGAGLFCCWLFASCLLLCAASAGCILATLWRLIVGYRRVYKPLSVMLARRGGSEGLRLVTYSRREEKEIEGGGGVMALYRSVLYIHREGGGDAAEREDADKKDEGGREGAKERLLVTLKPTGGGGATRDAERGGREERGLYRKTLFRLISREEEIDGWRDVVEECRVTAEDGARRRGGGQDEGMSRERSGGASRKRYSVILREEREEAGVGREELDWVVGGWEVKRGEGEGEDREEPRSSWGEWLEHFLPRMPWGVTTPPEGEVAQLGQVVVTSKET
uniref:platelet glycoprotein Ib alpha chain-like n=1 Tax=Semicossyphus pulcher TaxID=241346 RepID=UPI0037E98E27